MDPVMIIGISLEIVGMMYWVWLVFTGQFIPSLAIFIAVRQFLLWQDENNKRMDSKFVRKPMPNIGS